MTVISRHTYTAEIDGPGTELSITGGQITLDAGRIPHAEAELTLAVENSDLLDDLDPRDSRRIRIGATGEFGAVTRTREFNLGIRSVTPNRADGTVRVQLASDEAMLSDYAQLTEDTTPFDLASSLRSIVNYVLNKAIPGAALEAMPANDADMTPYWEVTNLLRNPAVVTNLSNWSAGGGCSLTFVAAGTSGEVGVNASAATGAVFAVDTSKYNIPAMPGTRYTFAVTQRNVSGGGNGRAVLRFLDNNNATISEIEGPTGSIANTNSQVSVTAVAPPSTAKIAPFWRFAGGAGRTYRLDEGILHRSRFPAVYFSGGTAAGGGYTFSFEGPSNDSASIRTPVQERDPESLVWNAGVSGMDFLQPLLMSVGLRLVCDEQRRWTLRSEDYRSSGSQSWRYGVNITAADESLSREDESWFDAAVYEYRWSDRDGIEQVRTDSYSLNPTPTKVLRREINAAFPGPGRAQHVVKRAQGKGRTLTVSSVPTWQERTDQALTIRLDGSSVQTGISATVAFDLDTDSVTVGSRTTDTPAGAIDLLPGTINALTGTIANL